MIYNGIITFGTNAVQITAAVTAADGTTPFPSGAFAWRVEIEPLRANTHVAYVGLSNVTTSATGASLQELAAPVTGTPLDRFVFQASGSERNFDPSVFYCAGTTTEKLRATVWSA